MTDYTQALAAARARYAQELNDPALAARLAGITHAEVGGQGPEARQAFMESVLNRAAARNQTLGQTLTGSYFPAVTYERAGRLAADPRIVGQYGDMTRATLGGSNVGQFATGNASGTVGFAGGPQVAAYGGERFGIEGPDAAWARRLAGGAMPAPMPSTPQAPTQSASGTAPQVQAQAATPAAPFTAPPDDMGQLAALFLQGAQARRQREQEQQAADQARRNALFGGGGLAGLYG